MELKITKKDSKYTIVITDVTNYSISTDLYNRLNLNLEIYSPKETNTNEDELTAAMSSTQSASDYAKNGELSIWQ